MVAVVFQHQSAFREPVRYKAGTTLGYSGASAVKNGVQNDYGADVHLHIHGLNASGRRVDFTKFISQTAPSPNEPQEDEVSRDILIRNSETGAVAFANLVGRMWIGLAQGYPELLQGNGFIENADGMQAPNANVTNNVFEYFHSIATRPL